MKSSRPDRVPKDVYLSFIRSLFGNRGTLVAGVIVHVAAFLAVAVKLSIPLYYYFAAGIFFVFVMRMISFRNFYRIDPTRLSYSQIERWENIYVVGAAATTATLGIASAYAIFIIRDSFAQLTCVAVTFASLASIVGRNYGSHKAVDMQTLACCFPMIVGCMLAQDLYLTVLASFLVPFVLTTRSMANGIRNFLYENVIARREITIIADRFDVALNNMPHGLVMVDRSNRIQVINRKACDLLKIGDPDRLKDRDLGVVLRYGARYSFMNASQPDLILRQMAQVSEGRISRILVQFPESLSLEFSANRMKDGGAVLIFEDVSSRVQAEQKILQMVRFDGLTGLPNRQYFSQLVQDHLTDKSKTDELVGFMIVDVDDFKHVNDLRGHVTGDRLLCALSARMQAALKDAIVGRLMGDEFIIFFSSTSGRGALEAEIRRVHAALQGLYNIDGDSIGVSLSAGYVILKGRDYSMEECSVKADLALFESKARLRGGITGFEKEMDGRYVEQQKLKADLRNAIAAEELSLVYQPMYTADGSKIECAEALARWIHPQKGAIAPDIFIRLAEDMGIISEITEFVLFKACRECKTWPDDLSVSVNLSARDLRDTDIIALVNAALTASGLPSSRLHLEITESCLIEEPATVRSILAKLRSQGITIAIDDFGTGFSSLSYLDTLPLDVVKIDRSFVRNIVEDTRRLKLLRGTVNLARELGLAIVTEGVETKEQLRLINEYQSTDLVQGYVFSPPVPSETIGSLVRGLAARNSSPRVA
ncbi:putative bifunctional diguanylate cyclase/phosphodiesterase [Oryzifoliimicrobium ureilyticus]|uniref:putative bifunctional diguanylate cyclase/phosphodiesterase n=1 Tax=Oryzifoliimicrobium ureilyticus TaxID=3113724 RepID=UPI0030763FBC